MGSTREPDGRGSGRSPQEFLDAIRSRGTSLRRRRSVARVVLAVTLPVTTVVAAFVFVPHLTGAPATTINVSGGSTGGAAGTSKDAPGTVSPDPGAPVAAPIPSPVSSPPAAQAHVASPRPVRPVPTHGPGTFEVSPGPVQSPVPHATVSASPVPGGPHPDVSPSPPPVPIVAPVPCGAGDVDFAITTNKAAYGNAETVAITMRVHNRTSKPCDVPDPKNSCNSGFVVVDAGGRQVWPTGPQPMSPCYLSYTTLEAGRTMEAGFTWDQNEWVCDTKPHNTCYERVPPGDYTVTGYWIGGVEGKANFTVN